MTTPENVPAWLHVGAEVGTYWGFQYAAPTLTTVEGFTEEFVVLGNGDKFSINYVLPDDPFLLKYQTDGTVGIFLVPGDNTGLQRVLADQAHRELAQDARRRYHEWSDVESDVRAWNVISAFTDLLPAGSAA